MVRHGRRRQLFDGTMTDGDWSLIGGSVLSVLLRAQPGNHPHGRAGLLLDQRLYRPTGMGWAALFFGEVPSPWIGVAVALLFAGLFLVNRSSPPGAKAGSGR